MKREKERKKLKKIRKGCCKRDQRGNYKKKKRAGRTKYKRERERLMKR